MEHLDKLIPLAILGVVGAILIYLVRRASQPEAPAPIQGTPLAVVPQPVPVDSVVIATLAAPAAEKPVLRKQRKQAAPVEVAPLSAAPSPIVSVLGMLKKKDTLLTAFLLREILAPPVSKR